MVGGRWWLLVGIERDSSVSKDKAWHASLHGPWSDVGREVQQQGRHGYGNFVSELPTNKWLVVPRPFIILLTKSYRLTFGAVVAFFMRWQGKSKLFPPPISVDHFWARAENDSVGSSPPIYACVCLDDESITVLISLLWPKIWKALSLKSPRHYIRLFLIIIQTTWRLWWQRWAIQIMPSFICPADRFYVHNDFFLASFSWKAFIQG